MKGANWLESLLWPRGFLGKQGGSLEKPDSWCRTPSCAELCGLQRSSTCQPHFPAHERDRQKDGETEIKSKALRSWAQSSYPSYLEWSLTGYSLTQNMSQVFWPKFHGLSGFLMLNRNLKLIPNWNSIDSGPAGELGTGRHFCIGVTSPYLPTLLIWILHLPCPFQFDMFPSYSQDSRWPCKSRLPRAPRPEAASVQWLGTGYFWWRLKLYQTFPIFQPKMLIWEAHWQRTHSWRVSPFFMFYNLQMKN